MSGTHPKRSPHRSRRILRSETLEPRWMLAGDFLSASADVVPVVAAEELPGCVAATPGPRTLEPVTELKHPQTISGPASGANPAEFDPSLGHELGQSWQLPDNVDPSSMPGWGCPNGEMPDRDSKPEAWEQWILGEMYSVNCGPAEATRAAEARNPGVPQHRGDPLVSDVCQDPEDVEEEPVFDPAGKGPGKPSEDTNDEGSNDEKPNPIDEGEGEVPIHKDSEPEGDDPDELHGALVDQAMADYGDGNATQTETSGPERLTGERGDGLGRVEDEARPGVEDGGPDESTSPVSALDAALLAEQAAYPTPDDDGGPPPGPEFGQTELLLRATIATAASDSGTGEQNGLPTPDDDGSGPAPPPTA